MYTVEETIDLFLKLTLNQRQKIYPSKQMGKASSLLHTILSPLHDTLHLDAIERFYISEVPGNNLNLNDLGVEQSIFEKSIIPYIRQYRSVESYDAAVF